MRKKPEVRLPTEADPVLNGMWLTGEKQDCFSKPELRGRIGVAQRLSSSRPREAMCSTQGHTADACDLASMLDCRASGESHLSEAKLKPVSPSSNVEPFYLSLKQSTLRVAFAVRHRAGRQRIPLMIPPVTEEAGEAPFPVQTSC